jgi:hypothetical protein
MHAVYAAYVCIVCDLRAPLHRGGFRVPREEGFSRCHACVSRIRWCSVWPCMHYALLRYKEEALAVADDPDVKFDLALQLNKLEVRFRGPFSPLGAGCALVGCHCHARVRTCSTPILFPVSLRTETRTWYTFSRSLLSRRARPCFPKHPNSS